MQELLNISTLSLSRKILPILPPTMVLPFLAFSVTLDHAREWHLYVYFFILTNGYLEKRNPTFWIHLAQTGFTRERSKSWIMFILFYQSDKAMFEQQCNEWTTRRRLPYVVLLHHVWWCFSTVAKQIFACFLPLCAVLVVFFCFESIQSYYKPPRVFYDHPTTLFYAVDAQKSDLHPFFSLVRLLSQRGTLFVFHLVVHFLH